MRRLLVSSVCLTWLAGCGSDGPSAIPIEDLSERVKEAVCANSVRCGVYLDTATCAGSIGADLQLQASVKAGKVKYDGRAAAACLELVKSAGCNLSDGFAATIASTTACDDAVKGTVLDGGGCINGQECVSGHCDRAACGGVMCCMGQCLAAISLGGSCANNGGNCAEGLYCKVAGTGSGTCQKPVAAGAECGAGDNCVAGTICAMSAATGKSTCAKPPGAGQPCTQEVCDRVAADFCDPTTKTCLSRLAVGAACSPAEQACLPYARCDASSMKCVVEKVVGSACTDDAECPLSCENNVCTGAMDIASCP